MSNWAAGVFVAWQPAQYCAKKGRTVWLNRFSELELKSCETEVGLIARLANIKDRSNERTELCMSLYRLEQVRDTTGKPLQKGCCQRVRSAESSNET